MTMPISNSSPTDPRWEFSLEDFKRAFEASEAAERQHFEKLPQKFAGPDEGVQQPAPDDQVVE